MIDFILYDSVTSTNDLLKEKALRGAEEGTVIAALKQTNGRGRQGKAFISDEGGMYLSILLRPKEINFDTALITSMTAVAVCKAIEKVTRQKTSIKWVNDILINNKKACGILCESFICGKDSFVIVGIGLNYFCSEFDDKIKDIAVNIFKTQDKAKEDRLTQEIINSFFEIYNSKSFLDDYIKRSIILNKEISFIRSGKKIFARAIDIDNKCRLKVKYTDGKQELLSSGEISVNLKEL